MNEPLRDPQILREVLLRRTLRAVATAAGILRHAARGKRFVDDDQRWACLGLIRLAPALVAWYEPDPEIEESFPDCFGRSKEEVAELDAILNKEMTREECAAEWAKEFREKGPFASYTNEEEAREYGRKVHDDAEAIDALNMRLFEEADRKRRLKAQQQRRRRR